MQLHNMLCVPSPFRVLVLGYFWGGDICRVNAVCEEPAESRVTYCRASPLLLLQPSSGCALCCCCCCWALSRPLTSPVSPAAQLSMTHRSIHNSIFITDKSFCSEDCKFIGSLAQSFRKQTVAAVDEAA